MLCFFLELRIVINEDIIKNVLLARPFGSIRIFSPTINLLVLRYNLMRGLMIQECNLPTTDNMLIPLYCNDSRGSEADPLGIGLIKVRNHTEGKRHYQILKFHRIYCL